MTLNNNHFPVFEANQVLTSQHLNDIFGYLDQQTRLTRSNLIGLTLAAFIPLACLTGVWWRMRSRRATVPLLASPPTARPTPRGWPAGNFYHKGATRGRAPARTEALRPVAATTAGPRKRGR